MSNKSYYNPLYEMFEDTKWVIIRRKLKDRQYNGQTTEDEKANYSTQKLKTEPQEPH